MLQLKELPRKIWFLWLQGMASSPAVVKACYESWQVQNPNWEIIVLDNNNLEDYITVPSSTRFINQTIADITRIKLLAQYGGVWVDATCFCNKPLDTWIYDYMGQGFFVFERPGPDRMISNWFIASCPNNYITQTLHTEVSNYWRDNPRLTFYQQSRWPFLQKNLPRKQQKWFNTFYTKVLKVYPYFWFHYLFEKIYLRDETVKQQWDATRKISADGPHSLQFAGLDKPLYPEIKNEIDSNRVPVYKLVWKCNPSELRKDAILNYLLSKYVPKGALAEREKV